MGGGYSDLKIYFKSVVTEYNGTGFNIIIKHENYKGCSDFQVITHTIKFNNQVNPLYYNVLLFTGNDDNHKGEYVFGYYYPNHDNDIIESVSIYYSVLAPKTALVISIKTKGNQIYNCLPSTLMEARWDRAYNIDIYSCGSDLSKDLLYKEYNKLSLNRKIRFKIGKKSKEITSDKQILDSEYYRFIYIPEGNDSIIDCNHLFSLKYAGQILDHTNKINEYYLEPLDGKLYDGIMVYYKKEKLTIKSDGKKEPLLIEFIESSKKRLQIKKKDLNGYWWSEEPVNYNGDTELLAALKVITAEAKDDSITIILEYKKKYDGINNFNEENKNTYSHYTYTFQNAKTPILLFQRKKITIGKSGVSTASKIVDVYYLKAGGKQDEQPFLIVFAKDENKESKEAYYFSNTNNFKDWKKFVYYDKTQSKDVTGESLAAKLEERLGRIEANLKCLDQLSLLRLFAFEILNGDEPTVEEIKKEVATERPRVNKPPDPPDGLPIPWIVAGSVGGGVFVISSAALYGVYWYNTTIKLLT